MVIMSTNPNLTYSHRMEPVEFTRVEILSASWQNDFIHTAQAIITTKFINLPHNVDLTRAELLALMRSSGTGTYYKSKKIILEVIEGASFIHLSPCSDPRDILE